MASSLKGLGDNAIETSLYNLDESDIEEICEDEEDELIVTQEDICEEPNPRSTDHSDWEESDEEPLIYVSRTRSGRRETVRPLHWTRTNNFETSSSYDIQSEPTTAVKDPYEYFSQYIKPEFFEEVSRCTNINSTYKTGKSLDTTSEEMRSFIGVSMAIGILGLPRIRMFWAAETRAPLVANATTRNRYFQLRSNIKVVDDFSITPGMKAVDRFWKVRPLVSTIEHKCRQNIRSQNVEIDEQIIPFTGKCKMKQVIKGKPNPEGIKVFIMANPNGLPLDIYLYQGGGTPVESALYPMPEKMDQGGRVVMKLVDTLPKHCSIYIDRYFTSVSLLDTLLKRDIHATGTLKKDRIPEYQRPNNKKNKKTPLLKSDRTLTKEGRGSFDCIVREDKTIAVVKWLDSKPIHIASTESAVEPLGLCQRWSKKENQYILIPQPIAIKHYNTYMGGIDLLDRIIGKYPMRGRTGKWTARAIFHLFDFAAAASWIQYQQDAVANGFPRKRIKQYLDFKFDLAKHLIYGRETQDTPHCSSPSLVRRTRNSPFGTPQCLSPSLSRSTRNSPCSSVTEEHEELNVEETQRKRKHVQPIPHVAKRLKGAQHLPIFVQGNRAKCRYTSCHQQTYVKCSSCNIFLCFNGNRNCFLLFHTNDN